MPVLASLIYANDPTDTFLFIEPRTAPRMMRSHWSVNRILSYAACLRKMSPILSVVIVLDARMRMITGRSQLASTSPSSVDTVRKRATNTSDSATIE